MDDEALKQENIRRVLAYLRSGLGCDVESTDPRDRSGVRFLPRLRKPGGAYEAGLLICDDYLEDVDQETILSRLELDEILDRLRNGERIRITKDSTIPWG